MQCPFCKEQINSKNSVCEHCNNLLPKKRKPLTSIFIAILVLIVVAFINKGLENKNEKIINKVFSQAGDLPYMINDEVQIYRYAKKDKNSLVQYLKFVNYTKKEILKDFGNERKKFEDYTQKKELEVSCRRDSIKNMLAHGLNFYMYYHDKSLQVIGKILVNKELCEPYYKR